MDRGLYIAASGMLSEMVRQEQISNELANASTPGYKADRTSQSGFGELLLQNTRTGSVVGPVGLGVQIAETKTDLAPAPIHETGNPLDFAVEGEGFFAVKTPAGVRYTRNGQFTADGAGTAHRLARQRGAGAGRGAGAAARRRHRRQRRPRRLHRRRGEEGRRLALQRQRHRRRRRARTQRRPGGIGASIRPGRWSR